MRMPSDARPPVAHAVEPEAMGVVAARCFQLAQQFDRGPIRQALLAMATDYTDRARDAAQIARFEVEQRMAARESAPGRGGVIGWILERLLPAAGPARSPDPAPAAAPRSTALRSDASPADAPRRLSRLFRINAQ
jgi:hypothetical protein